MKRIITAAIALCLAVCLCACGVLDTILETANAPMSKPSQTLAPAASPAPAPKPSPAATPAPSPVPAESKGISPDFKAAMDSYERFFDEYIEFMNAYAANPGDVGLLLKYTAFLTKYAETMEAMESWENRDLSTEELAYYIEVTARIETKLLKAIG